MISFGAPLQGQAFQAALKQRFYITAQLISGKSLIQGNEYSAW
jgi:hypothetical protein